jgi:hypothetical protein
MCPVDAEEAQWILEPIQERVDKTVSRYVP